MRRAKTPELVHHSDMYFEKYYRKSLCMYLFLTHSHELFVSFCSPGICIYFTITGISPLFLCSILVPSNLASQFILSALFHLRLEHTFTLEFAFSFKYRFRAFFADTYVDLVPPLKDCKTSIEECLIFCQKGGFISTCRKQGPLFYIFPRVTC